MAGDIWLIDRIDVFHRCPDFDCDLFSGVGNDATASASTTTTADRQHPDDAADVRLWYGGAAAGDRTVAAVGFRGSRD